MRCASAERAFVAVLLLVAACTPGGDRAEDADRLLETHRYQEAAAAFERMSSAGVRNGDSRVAWAGRLGRARAEFALTPSAERARGFEAVWILAEGDAKREAETAYYASRSWRDLGDLSEATTWADRALQSAERSADPASLSLAYGALGTVHSNLGHYRESLGWNERRVALWRAANPGSTDLALALNNVGIDYRHFGRHAEALGVLEEALGIYRRADDPRRLAMVLNNLANVHMAIGDVTRGLAEKREALACAERAEDRRGLGLAHADLGEILREAGNLTAARTHMQQALAIHRQDRRAYGETLALIDLGLLELDEHRAAEAGAYAREALAIADRSGFAREQSVGRSLASRIAAASGDPQAAVRLAEDALARAEALDDPAVELEAADALGVAHEAASRLEDAAAAYRRGVALLDSRRGRLALGDLRLALGDQHLATYEGAVRTLFALGRPDEAFEIAEHARARLLLELLAEREGERPSAGRLDEVRAKLRDPATPDPEITVLVAEETRLLRLSRLPRPASLAEVREDLARDGAQVFAYFWGDRDVYGWRIDRTGARSARLGSAGELAAQVEFLRAAVAAGRDDIDWRQAAAGLYRRLVAPLAPDPPGQALIVPDGPLCYLPFELLLPTDGASPMGMTGTIAYGPSASVLLALAQAPSPGIAEREILGVGASIGSRTGLGGTRSSGSPTPLPFAEEEARAITSLFAAGSRDLLVGPEATLDRWLAMRPERYRYLHIAAHARVSELPGEPTAIAFSGGELDLPRVRALRLRAELVTLSACDTALGRRVRGEGVVGLTHAFLGAGARGVVASLWRVEDEATEIFMKRFYAELRRGDTPAQALLAARRWCAGQRGPMSQPSAWAGFVLVGGPL